MQMTVINLASQESRWADASRQFNALGLQPVRQLALPGSALDDAEAAGLAGLYSERLNRLQYHKPLAPGEIGCYASHMAAWQRLLASGEAVMAVFEDDVQFDADLAQVLEAVAQLPVRFDLVKLIGRRHEKIRARRPLHGRRELITYRRVPSLTGAYVISARGAQKLLAFRRPFGRPVDVDMRHWWECGLDVLGVHPYPVRGAPSSRQSTIGARTADRSSRARLRKLWLQMRYTWLNGWAAQRQPCPLAAPASQAPHAVPAPPVPPVPARRRNLVVLRAGDASLHPQWLSGRARDFDLFISYYGKTPGRYRDQADFYEERPGPKWPGIAALLKQHPQLVEQYESFWFPDDDLSADTALIDRMFAFFCAYRLCLAQPALTRNSYHTWNTLLQDRRCHIRYTRFVEVMAPLFSRAALRLCAPTFSQSRSGWGLAWVWPGLCRDAGLGRIALLDATPVHHTRPVGGELYRNHPEMDPRADAARLLRAYGIQDVRAVAKYSFEGQVRDVALPLGERLLFWLKRLNGRRKHRAPA
ncbi:MAG TPA: glycosyltransferase family 25 protein [Burkholderiaceae bacterium]|nr:glycosyltransferase family 25 protein [Burkholderiaceae bacterium]